MDKPFSAGHTLLSPLLELDNYGSFPISLSSFHQIDGGFNDILFAAQSAPHPPPPPLAPQAAEDVIASDAAEPARGRKNGGGGRKRALRKDRHSKIRTAQGLRDRRMRLSLDVAQEFFDIQDMLGFDKASKTLRWLITAAKPAIEELIIAVSGPKMASSNGGGSSSKSNDSSTSGLESGDKKGPKSAAVSTKLRESDAQMAKRTCRRPTATIARDSRIKARARARERTEKKNQLRIFSTVPLEAVKEDSSSHDVRSSVLDHFVAEVEEHCSRLPNRHQQLPVTIFDYSPMSPNDTVSLFHEQWDMEIMLQADVQRHAWET